MDTASTRPDKSRNNAARDLRRAVHNLAHAALSSTTDTTELHRAAELVDAASAALESPGVSSGRASYRSKSLFQGETHVFSPALIWEAAQGPEGQEAFGFRVTLSDLYEGPPGAVHGGYLAGLFDELLGAVQRGVQESPAYTAKLGIKYRALTPLHSELVFRGWVVKVKGRRVLVSGSCTSGETRCADAEALFVAAPVHHG